ncbi:MAG: APC family permease, partial [Bacteroidia bacterium]
MSSRQIGFWTALAIVVANMIGTGVFTSLGFQVLSIPDGFSLLMLWITGGALALCGALTYSEIASALPENGGEYFFLSKLFHPSLGFISGWISVTVGFSAPIAASAMALVGYSHAMYPFFNEKILAIVVIITVAVFQSMNYSIGNNFQKLFTAFKVLVILIFIILGLNTSKQSGIEFLPSNNSFCSIFSSGFAISLIYVTYAYSGWNAATYITGEIVNPKKTIPRVLLIGTLVVLTIYTLLNYVFLKTTPIGLLSGKLEIGIISANQILGSAYGKYMGLIIAILLISGISAMTITGPRVIDKMGQEYNQLKFLSGKNKHGLPIIAIITQSLIAITLVVFSAFDSLINYIGF